MASPLQLFLIREPRSLFLASNEWVLLMRPPPSPSTDPASTDALSVVVELLPKDEVDMDAAILLNGRVSGCLGVLAVGNDTFLPVITSATTLGSSYSRSFSGIGTEPIHRILSVDFFCLTSPSYDYLHAPTLQLPPDSTDYLDDPSSSSLGAYQPYSGGNGATRVEPTDHPCQAIRKILSNSSFYFSSGPDAFDLSTRLQARLEKAQSAAQRNGHGGIDEEPAEDGYQAAQFDHDRRFLYNHFLVAPLLSFRSSLSRQMREVFDRQGFMVLAIQGYCGQYDLTLGGQPAVLSLTSRLGWKRAGTRFNVRGVDDDGGVANFVETETILRTRDLCFSFVQTRGSVPLFWEEGGSQPFAPKITITRPIEASLPAFLRHFEDLLEQYSSVHIINLLAAKDGESALTAAYEAHLCAAKEVDENVRDGIGMTGFDFHAKARVGGIESVKQQLATEVGQVEEGYGACVVGIEGNGTATAITNQSGVFRTNCKDCLDRTNAVQDSLSRFALEDFIRNTQPAWAGSQGALWSSHRTLWADNGDALSKTYTGTGAINTSFTRTGKKSFAGMLSDASKSVNRVFQQQFVDGGKQKAIDALLGNLATSRKVRVYNPIHETLRSQLRARSTEYTSFESTSVWVGTYNLNGKAPSSESLLPWLFPVSGPDPSFLVLAFQEIVPLSPQMIMATDPEKKRRWENHILQTVADRPDKKSDYILLRSGQLVGTALIVLCKKEIAGEVRNVEAATKKTGLKGMAGNKGAVAIRLDYRDTSFCFLTAHLAAGHNAVEERNQDYFTIADGLHFARGKTIASHDNVVWAADTNYRISLPNDEVRSLAEEDDYASLYAADQLNLAMRTRGVFRGYQEAPLLFRPTYKYDNGTDTYDSSEKMRIPAYTDRILYSGQDLDINRYQRAELFTSDHRPVYALFRARIRSIDQTKRAALRKQLLQELMQHAPEENLDQKLSRLTNGVAALDLPPPSDDQQAWWNGQDGTFVPPPLPPKPRDPAVSNPFDPSYYTSTSPSQPTIAPPSRRAPPVIPRKPPQTTRGPLPKDDGQLISTSPPSSSSSSFSSTSAPSSPAPAVFQAVRRKPPPPIPRSSTPPPIVSPDTTSVPATTKSAPPVPQRPGKTPGTMSTSTSPSVTVLDEVEAQPTGESWQVIEGKYRDCLTEEAQRRIDSFATEEQDNELHLKDHCPTGEAMEQYRPRANGKV
ncbi:hypothetical protein JCM5296_002953 [Sporobolomyces johnsonii]